MKNKLRNTLALILVLALMLALCSSAFAARRPHCRRDYWFDIYASAGTGGAISPNEVSTYTKGDDGTFLFTPDPGFMVKAVWVDDVKVATGGSSYTFTNIKADHVIHVEFTAAPVPDLPATGGESLTAVPLALLALCIAAAGVMLFKARKQQ